MKKYVLIIMVILMGICVLTPDISFQSGMAQGDHGRDFYATNQSSKGEMPFRDYWWAYGPLMPYYYALSFNTLGDAPQSIIIAKNILIIFGGVFFYLILSLFCSPSLAIVGTLWFYLFNPQFTHTFNHTGAISLSIALIYFIFRYTNSQNVKHIHTCLLLVAIIALIKLNIGMAFFLATLISICLINYSRQITFSKDDMKKICIYFLICMVSVLSVYVVHLIGLPYDYVKQCLYLSPEFSTSYNLTFFEIIKNYLLNIKTMLFSVEGYDRYYVVLFIASIYFAVRLKLGDNNTESKKLLSLPIDVLAIFIVLGMHEYLISGVVYKLIWTRPFEYLLIFICVDRILKSTHKSIEIVFIFSLLYICCINHIGRNNWKEHIKETTYNQFFEFDQGRYYSQNSTKWFETVKNTIKHLESNLDPDEVFLAIPYDPIYYFLLDRKSPTRFLYFAENLNITDNQQKEIVNQLNTQAVRYVVMSNQISSKVPGLGYFGKTYCQRLDKYINENFEIVVQFGEWDKDPNYMSNHGTRILKRKE